MGQSMLYPPRRKGTVLLSGSNTCIEYDPECQSMCDRKWYCKEWVGFDVWERRMSNEWEVILKGFWQTCTERREVCSFLFLCVLCMICVRLILEGQVRIYE